MGIYHDTFATQQELPAYFSEGVPLSMRALSLHRRLKLYTSLSPGLGKPVGSSVAQRWTVEVTLEVGGQEPSELLRWPTTGNSIDLPAARRHDLAIKVAFPSYFRVSDLVWGSAFLLSGCTCRLDNDCVTSPCGLCPHQGLIVCSIYAHPSTDMTDSTSKTEIGQAAEH